MPPGRLAPYNLLDFQRDKVPRRPVITEVLVWAGYLGCQEQNLVPNNPIFAEISAWDPLTSRSGTMVPSKPVIAEIMVWAGVTSCMPMSGAGFLRTW
jgi:hypothetical protein